MLWVNLLILDHIYSTATLHLMQLNNFYMNNKVLCIINIRILIENTKLNCFCDLFSLFLLFLEIDK